MRANGKGISVPYRIFFLSIRLVSLSILSLAFVFQYIIF